MFIIGETDQTDEKLETAVVEPFFLSSFQSQNRTVEDVEIDKMTHLKTEVVDECDETVEV